MAQFFPQLLNAPAPTADGAAYATSAALTDVSPAPQLIVPANWMIPGQVLRVTAHGRFSNTGTPTLLLGVYWGGVAGVKLAATGAITTITAAVAWPWRVEALIICRSIGATGSFVTTGQVFMPASLTQSQAAYTIDAAATAPVTVDTTAAKALTLGAQWGTSSASNTLTVHQFLVEALV